VLDLVKGLPVRVEPVGRLDYDTEGALLLTNDGQLAHDLTHPSREVPKTYLAVVEGVPNRADLKAIREGVPLDDGPTAPAKALVIGTERGNSLLEVTVIEGRNRLIRRMMKQLGHAVLELRRERFGSISIDGLAKGQLRELTNDEVRELRSLAVRRPKR
jgi:pseudouridine synthase